MFTFFATTTTFHGIPYVVATQIKTAKIFWIIVLIGSFSMAIFSTCQVVEDYLNAPVAVIVSSQKSATLAAPDLMICPTRGLNATKMILDRMPTYIIDEIMTNFSVDVDWLRISNFAVEMTQADQDMRDFMVQHSFKDYKQLLMHYSYDPDEFVQKFKLELWDIFDGSDPGVVDKTFGKMNGYASGICFTFTNSNKSISWPGMVGGYQLILKLPKSGYFDNSFTDGWHLAIASPLLSPPSNYIRVLPNTAVDIEISRVDVDRLPAYSWPKSGLLCRDSISYKTSDGCVNDVFLKLVERICNCTAIQTQLDPSADNSNIRFCNPFEYSICFITQFATISNVMDNLKRECLPVCKETIFEAKPSYGAINKRPILMKYGLADDTDVSIVRISFPKMEYTTSFESVTLSTLVSNIGGQLGLWIGASIVSIIHLLSYLPYWVINLAKMGKTNVQQFKG